MSLDSSGPECVCGRVGCWEALACNSATVDRYVELRSYQERVRIYPVDKSAAADLKREVIPADVAAGRQEIKSVLLNVHAALDVKFAISHLTSTHALQRRDGADGPLATCSANPSATI